MFLIIDPFPFNPSHTSEIFESLVSNAIIITLSSYLLPTISYRKEYGFPPLPVTLECPASNYIQIF